MSALKEFSAFVACCLMMAAIGFWIMKAATDKPVPEWMADACQEETIIESPDNDGLVFNCDAQVWEEPQS